MKFTKWIVMGSGSVILVLLSVVLIHPKTVHALAAALVQITNTDSNPVPTTTAVPGTPFFARIQLSGTATNPSGQARERSASRRSRSPTRIRPLTR